MEGEREREREREREKEETVNLTIIVNLSTDRKHTSTSVFKVLRSCLHSAHVSIKTREHYLSSV